TLLALNASGCIYGWGSNRYGLLLDSDNDIQTSLPTLLPFDYTTNVFTQIACGEKHCLAKSTATNQDSKVWGFGDNTYHQIDASTDTIKYSPVDITNGIFGGDCQVTTIFATYQTSGASCPMDGGNIAVWGRDLTKLDGSYTNVNVLTYPYLQVPARLLKGYFVGEVIIAFNDLNEIYVLGDNSFGQSCVGDLKLAQFPLEVKMPSESLVVSQNSHIQKLFTISRTSLIFSTLISNSSTSDKFQITAWGAGSHLNIVSNTSSIDPTIVLNQTFPFTFSENMTCLDIFCDSAVMLTSDGAFYAWGQATNARLGIDNIDGYLDTPTKVTEFNNLTSVATGNSHTLALTSDGVVYGVGSNSNGQFCLGSYDMNAKESKFRKTGVNDYLGVLIAQIAVGEETSYFLTSPIGETVLAGKKVKKIILPPTSLYLFIITQDGELYRHLGITEKITLPNAQEHVIDVTTFRDGTLDFFYFVTSLGNIYTMGSDNSYFQISQDPTVKKLLTPTLYATKESLGGVPYLISANNYLQVVALSSGWKCYGMDSTNPNVCSASGICVDVDTCACKSNVLGNDCSLFSCNGTLKNETNVCSGNGHCVAWNQCKCNDGYTGTWCDQYSCLQNGLVCSGNGECIGPNVCSCNNGWFGDKCEFKSCFSENETYGGASAKKRVTMKGRLCSKINTYL
ncbi:hypothetical protein C9374_010024, partial [Naegleria lovaniensis]